MSFDIVNRIRRATSPFHFLFPVKLIENVLESASQRVVNDVERDRRFYEQASPSGFDQAHSHHTLEFLVILDRRILRRAAWVGVPGNHPANVFVVPEDSHIHTEVFLEF
ncbi:MAG: hypothetical protein H6818_06365 [Phycisphaerales bacterium]|nr:hypothetical protein [Phycisphaerales bacterium]MCB9862888.1 hypothetical protein [Phycisphaerales bacterium]